MEAESLFTPIYQIRDRPYNQKITAEKRFLLIKEYEDVFLPAEKERLGKRFRKTAAIEKYCQLKGISSQSFYRWYRPYRERGIEGLLPAYRNRKGKSPYQNTFLPIVLEIINDPEPLKSFTDAFKKAKRLCEQRGVHVPVYETFLRMLQREGLADRIARRSNEKRLSSEPVSGQVQQRSNNDVGSLKPRRMEWIRFTNKRAFNIAMYKYNLVLPFLHPGLSREQKLDMVQEIVSRKHYVLPGVEIKISQASLYRYISAFKEKGFDGLVPKYYVRKKPATKQDTFGISLEINLKNPLASLRRLKDVIANSVLTSPKAKEVALKFLENEIKMVSPKVAKYRPLWLGRALTEDEVDRLETYKAGRQQRHRDRARVILMAHKGHTMLEVVMESGMSSQTIYRWLQKFRKEGIESIQRKRHDPERERVRAERRVRVIEILHGLPSLYGINRTSWNSATVAQAYNQQYEDKISSRIAMRVVGSTNYTWRHAVTVLTSPDPLYREKTARVLNVLRNLEEGEAFFFVDEAGPYAVKQYGGKALTEKGTTRVVPQYQKTKGSVTLIGGLDAVANQMTWTYIRTKSSAQVIKFLKVLRTKYADWKKLYVTWDAVSWHDSDALRTWLRETNESSRAKNEGPIIDVVPLPVNSQFLNVIESVFSGMKRAVIHNSDYRSEDEMKAAISRHFEERNDYFRENPKRAGNKIWDKEYFKIEEIQGGLFKKM